METLIKSTAKSLYDGEHRDHRGATGLNQSFPKLSEVLALFPYYRFVGEWDSADAG